MVWTGQTKSSSPTWSNQSNSMSVSGIPIGLLLVLTYTQRDDNPLTTFISKSASPTWSNVTKN